MLEIEYKYTREDYIHFLETSSYSSQPMKTKIHFDVYFPRNQFYVRVIKTHLTLPLELHTSLFTANKCSIIVQLPVLIKQKLLPPDALLLLPQLQTTNSTYFIHTWWNIVPSIQLLFSHRHIHTCWGFQRLAALSANCQQLS